MTTKTFPHALAVATALATSACTVTTVSVPMAPPGVTVRPEIAQGFAAYQAALAPFGTWGPDYRYGVHWCPSQEAIGGPGASFHPYLSRGHWETSGTPIGQAPAGSPVWQSEDRDTWGEITTHHGWWVHSPSPQSSTWCWVPGTEETPARVAWREGDGFVGWAPEDPDDVIVLDEGEYESWYDWTFTLIATVLDDALDRNTLSGDAQEHARRATAPGRASDGSFPRRKVGPSGSSVAAARGALANYAVKHPEAIAAAAARYSAAEHPASATSTKTVSASASTGTKVKEAKDTKEKDGLSVTVGVLPPPLGMPPAMVYYDAFLAEPPVVPPGLLPQGARMAAAAPPSPHGSLDVASPVAHGPSQTAHSRVSHDSISAVRMPSHAQHGAAVSSTGGSSSYHSSGSRSSGSSHSSSSHSSSHAKSGHR
jgi:hypothetical protein